MGIISVSEGYGGVISTGNYTHGAALFSMLIVALRSNREVHTYLMTKILHLSKRVFLLSKNTSSALRNWSTLPIFISSFDMTSEKPITSSSDVRPEVEFLTISPDIIRSQKLKSLLVLSSCCIIHFSQLMISSSVTVISHGNHSRQSLEIIAGTSTCHPVVYILPQDDFNSGVGATPASLRRSLFQNPLTMGLKTYGPPSHGWCQGLYPQRGKERASYICRSGRGL